MDAEVVEEAAVDRDCDGHGPSVRYLVLNRVDVIGADGLPSGGGVLTRLAEYCDVGLNPEIGRLTIMGEDVELGIPFPVKEGERGVVGDALVCATVELVPNEATGETRVLVRVAFSVGYLLDGGEGLADA